MIIRIVLYRLRPEACGNYLATNQQWAAEAFDKVGDVIPQIVKLETGINENRADWSCDFSVLLELTSWEGIELFNEHPQVKKVNDFMNKISIEKRVVEFIN